MDLAVLGKRSILIATPGQTEQEYLSSYLEKRKIALCFNQKDFKLGEALQKASKFPYCTLENTGNGLPAAIASFLSTINAG
jgi:UDP-N-acetylglucosamine:LPS N-acetylglucosamine transferase